ncbi:MAG: hypothetical protein PUF30_01410 [bacterium]|nr:hypothetical protein [Parabacteroides distasonis]MCI6875684.1 hypothetical protein [Parabacteroides sp.]MDD6099861.1 hypothetical protein [bacterium]MDD6749456.1 hypothetical protein [bacterium]MDD6765621.1 hypothetical protein [bacterium]
MSTNNSKVQTVIEAAFQTAIDRLAADTAGNLLSDLYVQVDQETGELQIYDEEEHLIEKTIIYDWVNSQEAEEQFVKRVVGILKNVLATFATKNSFDAPRFLKPFSVSLTDEDFVVVEELMFLDDDLLRLDDPLLQNLDKDLDDFLAKLLPDIK